MKPRIKLINGLWYCSIYGAGWRGMGYTPSLAYRDWKQFKGGVWVSAHSS